MDPATMFDGRVTPPGSDPPSGTVPLAGTPLSGTTPPLGKVPAAHSSGSIPPSDSGPPSVGTMATAPPPSIAPPPDSVHLPDNTSLATSFRNFARLRPELSSDQPQQFMFEHQYTQRQQRDEVGDLAIYALSACTRYMHIEEYCSASFGSDEAKPLRTSLLNLENALIDAITGQLASGVCYVSTFLVKDRYVYTRWLDGGNLSGYISRHNDAIKDTHSSVNVEDFILWQVFTQADITKRSESYRNQLTFKRGDKTGGPSTGLHWAKTVSGPAPNKKSVQKALGELVHLGSTNNSIQLLGAMVHVNKQEHHLRLKERNAGYHVHTGIYEDYQQVITTSLELHQIRRPLVQQPSFKDQISNISMQHPLSVADQEGLINLLDNDAAVRSTGRTSLSHCQYFSTGTGDRNDDGQYTSKYIPTSVRNSVLYHFRLGKYELVKKILCIYHPGHNKWRSTDHSSSEAASRTKRQRTFDGEEQDDNNILDTGDVQPLESHSVEVTPYVKFLQHMSSPSGILQLRLRQEDLEIYVMNDIDLQTGLFQKSNFIHTSKDSRSPSNTSYVCTCRMYGVTQRMQDRDSNYDNKCCHVRILKEELQHSPSVETPLQSKIMDHRSNTNVAVLKLVHSKTSIKFSVASADMRSCAVVTLQGNRFNCQAGRCRAGKGHSRNARGIDDPDTCEHLRALNANRELWQHDIGLSDGDSDDGQSGAPNMEDEEYLPHQIFKSLSTHKPKDQSDPSLVEAKHDRDSIYPKNSEICVDDDGCLMKRGSSGPEPLKLYPKLDREALCNCNMPYWSEDQPDGILKPRFPGTTKVYMLHGVGKFMVYNRECLNEKEECRVVYTGEQDAIHFLSSNTAAGDEVGWDFISHVKVASVSCSAYCSISGQRYYTKANFMSRQVFVNWIFSWMANFKTDFRKQCQSCGTNPKILACDGTKLGMFLRFADVTPIEHPTTAEEHEISAHRRTSRQFFAYLDKDNKEKKDTMRQAQSDLMYYVAKYTSNIDTWKKTNARNEAELRRCENERKENILKCIPPEMGEVFKKYVHFEFNQNTITKLNPIMEVLASASPITSLINFRFFPLLMKLQSHQESIYDLEIDLPEVFCLLQVAMTSGELILFVDFFCSLINKAKEVHETDPDPQPAQILEDYNPMKTGRAYYFTKHGGRVRDLPHYRLSKESETSSRCRKVFQEATKNGVTYLFLWFCPLHGHCYGFHIITGSEGRKDPASSAFLYLEEPPRELFYDFSCQLEEYCLNREPAFWKECRFFHDIFHGFSHKCPFVYKSTRLASLESGINSEVCEQFNSYIQKIKYSARSMNKAHFVFYLQFFIDIWNEMKGRKEETMQAMAAELLL